MFVKHDWYESQPWSFFYVWCMVTSPKSLNLGEQRWLCICQFRDPRKGLPLCCDRRVKIDALGSVNCFHQIVRAFREFWRDDRDGCTCASSQRLERCRCVLPLYIVWFTLVSQYRIYVYWYIIYNVCIYIYYDATCYSYLIFMFLFPACHDILLFDMWHFKESKSSAS